MIGGLLIGFAAGTVFTLGAGWLLLKAIGKYG